MTSPAAAVHGSMPPDTGMRIGIAHVSGTTVTVTVGGALIDCQFVTPGIYAEGDPVVVLRGAASWVVLGGLQGAPQMIEAGRESVSFTALTSFSVGVAFTRPFASIPNVVLNINSNAAATTGWFAKATSISETAFSIVLNGPSATWAGVSVQWTAVSV